MRKSGGGAKSIRVFLVDDHPLIRQALRDAMRRERDIEVCGEADDRDTALKGIAAAEPDLAIVDLHLRSSDGLDLVRDLRDRHPKVLSLVLSMQDESITAERAVRAGARGYVSKQEPAKKIMEAVRKVLDGEIYWSEKAAAQVASRIAAPTRSAGGSIEDTLSERELQVFEMIGLGMSTAQISETLRIDVSTVETYRARIKEKLNLKSGSDLLQMAIRWSFGRKNR
ncbi:MAG TPA: response regulator transcription factor [Verrucomicrobiota bacterium]|nr:response regulator transcription factor [Verrucomicrobiota bacterium]HPU57066.1 response regulator transcription factor [Verrucomicrobiota bacterium]